MWVVAVVVAVGYYGHVRAQSGAGGSQSLVIPLRPIAPLSTVPVPPVFGMEGILADKTAAIALGKALFWDMQAGSDDIQACASCHFNAGADSRAINQINPGQAGGDNTFNVGSAPNYHMNPGTPDAGFGGFHDGDFPFHKLADVDQGFTLISDANDVSGSQGVFGLTKDRIVVDTQVDPAAIVHEVGGDGNTPTERSSSGDDEGMTHEPSGKIGPNHHIPSRNTGNAGSGSGNSGQGGHIGQNPGQTTTSNSVEMTSVATDSVFSFPDPSDPSKRINTRRTTGRNTPSAVDAVFNFRNFWDGRAQNVCNGTNPFGARDSGSHLMVTDGTDGTWTGPCRHGELRSVLAVPGTDSQQREMSADDRNFHQVGKKLLARVPLANQIVSPTDSVLGILSNASGKGLKTSYSA